MLILKTIQIWWKRHNAPKGSVGRWDHLSNRQLTMRWLALRYAVACLSTREEQECRRSAQDSQQHNRRMAQESRLHDVKLWRQFVCTSLTIRSARESGCRFQR
jgi:hypothetical protein